MEKLNFSGHCPPATLSLYLVYRRLAGEIKCKKKENNVIEEATAKRRGVGMWIKVSNEGDTRVGGAGDYKLATLCRGYWKAKLRTTIHPFFEYSLSRFLPFSRMLSFTVIAGKPTNDHFA